MTSRCLNPGFNHKESREEGSDEEKVEKEEGGQGDFFSRFRGVVQIHRNIKMECWGYPLLKISFSVSEDRTI